MPDERALFTGSATPRPEPLLPAPLDPQLRTRGRYVCGQGLADAVEVSLLLGLPLLLTGDPGTGKTTLASALANERFSGRLLEMQVKSDSVREDLLYRIDDLARFRDAQSARIQRRFIDYITFRPLGEAILRACDPMTPLLHHSGRNLHGDEAFLDEVFGSDRPRRIPVVADLLPGAVGWTKPERWVVLLDEVDKAPRDTPNDLLEELEKMAFAIPEATLRIKPPENAPRPVLILTSNCERILPDAFLRRCAFHHLSFPDSETLTEIVANRLGELTMEDTRLRNLMELFHLFRAKMSHKPGISELLRWLNLADKDQTLRDAVNRSAMSRSLKRLTSVLAKEERDIETASDVIDSWALTQTS